MSVHQKLGIILENKVIQKFSLEKMVDIFSDFYEQIWLIFDIEN